MESSQELTSVTSGSSALTAYEDTSDSGSSVSATEPMLGRENTEMTEAQKAYKKGLAQRKAAWVLRLKLLQVLVSQFAGSCLIGSLLLSQPEYLAWIQSHSYLYIMSLGLAILSHGAQWWKQGSYGGSMLFLVMFTGFESLTIGSFLAIYEMVYKLQTLLVFLSVFSGIAVAISCVNFFSTKGYVGDYETGYSSTLLIAGSWVYVNTCIIALFIPFEGLLHLVSVYLWCLVPLLYFSLVITYVSTYATLLGGIDWMFASVYFYFPAGIESLSTETHKPSPRGPIVTDKGSLIKKLPNGAQVFEIQTVQLRNPLEYVLLAQEKGDPKEIRLRRPINFLHFSEPLECFDPSYYYTTKKSA